MSPELKKKWVEALRSGKYKQGSSVLRTPIDGYCCLGVLCDVYDPKGWEAAASLSATNRLGYSYRYDGPRGSDSAIVFPPNPLLNEILSVDSRTAEKQREFFSTLANRNDTGFTFEQIALMIEESSIL